MPDQVSVELRLQPPHSGVSPGLVRRRRLEDRLRRGIAGPLTVVSAGAGSGKTAAIASWVANEGADQAAVAWLTVEATDNDLATFWSDVLGSLRVSGALPASSSLRDIAPAAGFGADELRKIRIGLFELPEPVVLVLDDFQEIAGVAVLESIGQLVSNQPPTLRLVLAARADPPMRLHRLRVSGQLTEIRSSELAFTADETAELFDHGGVPLSDRQVQTLLTRTQGWPTGLRLAAMSLDATDIENGISRFSGTEGSVAEYLIGEVTDRLSPEDREFVLRTSVAERLCGALADVLSGRQDSQMILEKLVGANAFVVRLGGQDDWFGYHPLLRDMLQHRLALEQPHVTADLHLVAARWFADNGEPVLAIRHAFMGRNWDELGGC